MRTLAKLLLALGATALGCVAAWTALRGHPRAVAAGAASNALDAERFLAERERERDAAAPALSVRLADRGPVPEADVGRLFVIEKRYFTYDPWTYYRRVAGFRERVSWPEHPDGGFEFVTNAGGYRAEADELDPGRDLLVLVTGDSHTDGLCNNAESFTALVRARLAAARPGRRVEALNTGVVGFSFYNYLGALEKHLELAPDAFVVAVYGGNDFLEVLKPHHYFRRTTPPPLHLDYWEEMQAAIAISSRAVVMVLNQVRYFQAAPDQVELALEAARLTSAEIARLCREHGVLPVFCYLPTVTEVDATRRAELDAAMARLGLGPDDLARTERLGDRYLASLRALDVAVVDLREHLGPDPGRYYWSDMHIDLEGHALVAELVTRELAARLPR